MMLPPAGARKMERASLSGLESSHVLLSLMSTTNSAPETVTTIEKRLALV
jgi:hypothetical protein